MRFAEDQRPTKSAVRTGLLASRAARSEQDIARARAAVRDAVLTYASGWRRVAAYLPMRTEPGSVELLAALAQRGVQVLIPLVLPDKDLDWALWPGREPLGVDAIASVDAVLVPALAISHDGIRLGRGGGSYDRALRRVGADVPIVALLFEGEYVEWLPSDEWDVPVTAAIGPSGVVFTT